MAHFAELDENNIVLRVVTVNNEDILIDGIESEEKGVELCKEFYKSSNKWLQTSYNNNFRFRYAGIGYYYDKINDVFIPPKYLDGMILNKETWDWEFPIPYPEDGSKYFWDENNLVWKKNEEND